MSKIRVSTDKMSALVDVKGDSEYLFIKVVNELFCNCVGKEGTEKIAEKLKATSAQRLQGGREEAEEVETEHGGQFRYKGFIYWKCSDCGEEKGFCLKKESEGVHCINCGSKHLFTERLKPLFVQCECGKSFRYMTNMDAKMFDMTCINCGSPISVEWNEKKGIYVTVK